MSVGTEVRPAPATGGSAATWRSRAFGLDLEGNVPISGLPPVQGPTHGPTTSVELISSEALERSWRPANPTRVEHARTSDGRLGIAIDHDDHLGYRLSTSEWGEYLVSADGLSVRCASQTMPSWRRSRFLTSRLLPLAAALRGLEVFHASAVSVRGAVIAMVGPRQAGKTSVAVRSVLQGASFVTDDLLALAAAPGHALAHPGAASMGVRRAEYRLLAPEQRRELGSFTNQLDKFYAEVPREDRALPLEVVYYLQRRAEGDELAIHAQDRPDPRLLLASSFFNRVIRDPARLVRQLDLCARISRTAAICQVSVPPHVDARSLAASLLEDATARLEAEGR
jgi:hypothetical protein